MLYEVITIRWLTQMVLIQKVRCVKTSAVCAMKVSLFLDVCPSEQFHETQGKVWAMVATTSWSLELPTTKQVKDVRRDDRAKVAVV